MTIVFVCEECHESDKSVTKCRMALMHHCGKMQSRCDICGKFAIVGPCFGYRRLAKLIASQKGVTPKAEDCSDFYCS